MSGSQLFVVAFGVLSAVVSALAAWRVATASGVKYKPLWIVGCLFGFVGFATSLNSPSDLNLQLGIQIPVVLIWKSGNGDILLRTLFPLLAPIVLVRLRSTTSRPDE